VPACAVCGYESGEAFKFCPECGKPLAPRGQAQRKTVTVLFCDIVGSTALGESTDPEALRALLARYFERMKQIVERHGGSVEKFIGDAVMAVFGVPLAHEDDALRACRAAVEMREALPQLGVDGRIGVSTGEVVTGSEERLATGDAVNVAARLQQAAQPGEALLSEATLELVRNAVAVEALEALDLKGKAEPVPAFRLLSVHEVQSRRTEVRFVGRQQELAVIREAWERALAEQVCAPVTIIGEAGVGKSRLVAEALALIEYPVLMGRCLPYGDGITYSPVVEVIKQLDALPSDPAAAAAIRSLLGETSAGESAEEIAWAFRKLLEEHAPLIAVFDDIQWAEETFLDLLEHVALLSSGSPILLLCMARPELVERRPVWPVMVRLEPLPTGEVEELIGERVPDELRERIAKAAGGNPLFVSEMLAIAGEGSGEVTVPPTLRSLLAARLDQLGPTERRVLECGAVEGEVFHRGAVQALAPAEVQVTPRLAGLVRKELVRRVKAHLPGEDGFRFRHLLVRDAAYDGLPKSARAELHMRFAAWLDARAQELVGLDEIVGYHLEQAWRYRQELGEPGEPELAATARKRLTAAEQRAISRQDYPAALKLAERALALVPLGKVDTPLEVDRLDASALSGNARPGLAAVGIAVDRAVAAGDRVAELTLRGVKLIWECQLGILPDSDGQIEAFVQDALPELDRSGSDLGLHHVYWLAGYAAINRGEADAAFAALEESRFHAQRLARHYEGWVPRMLITARALGTTPVPELLAWLKELEEQGSRLGLRRTEALALLGQAEASAMLGRFEEAQRVVTEVRREWHERGNLMDLAQSARLAGTVELLAGNLVRAELYLAEACDFLEQREVPGVLSELAAQRALVLYELDRVEEADDWAGRAAEVGDATNVLTEVSWRRAKAKVLARRGDHEGAERLAREAVSFAEPTDFLNEQANAYRDLAEVLRSGGPTEDAVGALEHALERYERKRNLIMADQVRARLAELRLAQAQTERA
jgi:class 3 adenylate cyclase/tetratricopeptide (TPR) repeat protein